VCTGGRDVLDIGDVDPLERPTSPGFGDVVMVPVKCLQAIGQDRPVLGGDDLQSGLARLKSVSCTLALSLSPPR